MHSVHSITTGSARFVAAPVAQQRDQRNGAQSQYHHQLEVIVVGDHRCLAGDALIERGQPCGRQTRWRLRVQHVAVGRDLLGEPRVHHLRIAREQRFDHRNADAAADIAHQAEHRRALVAKLRRQRGEGDRRQRHVDEAGAKTLREARPDDRGAIHLQVEARHLPQRDRGQRKARGDDEPGVDFAHEPADDEHRHQGADAARRGDQAGQHDGIIHQVLQQRRQQRQRREQHDADNENEHVAGDEVAVLEQGGADEAASWWLSACAR